MSEADHTRALFARIKREAADLACRTAGAREDAEPENVRAVVLGLHELYTDLGELLGISGGEK